MYGGERILNRHFEAVLAKRVCKIGATSDVYCFIGIADKMFSTVNKFRYLEARIPKGRVFLR